MYIVTSFTQKVNQYIAYIAMHKKRDSYQEKILSIYIYIYIYI